MIVCSLWIEKNVPVSPVCDRLAKLCKRLCNLDLCPVRLPARFRPPNNLEMFIDKNVNVDLGFRI